LSEDGLTGVYPVSDPEKRIPRSNREQTFTRSTLCKNAAYITTTAAKWDSIEDDPVNRGILAYEYVGYSNGYSNDALRRVRYKDHATGEDFVFITTCPE